MSTVSALGPRLAGLLGLTAPAIGVTFDDNHAGSGESVAPQPAGCCFWEPAQHQRLDTVAQDHANCSVGSYTHGLIPLDAAATRADTVALVRSGWVGEADLIAAESLPFTPGSITYEPLDQSEDPAVILARVSATGLMTLLGAVPDLVLARKPQCMIVPLAYNGHVAVSPGCAVSRTRTGMPEDDLTCAFPASALPSIVARLEASTAADQTVSAFAAADIADNFAQA